MCLGGLCGGGKSQNEAKSRRFGIDLPSRAFYEGVNPKTIWNNAPALTGVNKHQNSAAKHQNSGVKTAPALSGGQSLFKNFDVFLSAGRRRRGMPRRLLCPHKGVCCPAG